MVSSSEAKRKPPPWLTLVTACKTRTTASQPSPSIAHQAVVQQASSSNSTPTLPLTAEKMFAVAAQINEGTYTGAADTISVVKDHHLAQGFVGSEHLAREVKRATRTPTRGRGAPKQDAEIDLDAPFELELGDSPLVSGRPCCTNRLREVSAFRSLREIERSPALARSVHIKDNDQEETLESPVSMTDLK